MENNNKLLPTLALGLLILMLAWSSAFRVDQRKYAMVFQFGEVTKVVDKPGLYFRAPLLENVRYFDKRILTIDAEEPDRFQTQEKKNVLVDSFIKWRIANVEKFFKTFRGQESVAADRLRQIVYGGLRDEIGKLTVAEIISGRRSSVIESLMARTNAEVAEYGVQVVDVRLKRVDFPANISGAVYDRMQAERKRVANELRSEGSAEAEKIRADADRQREVILAQAYKQAQEVKGEGDAKAAGIYAEAYNQNPEFYSFYRSLEAYKQSFRNKSDVMVLDPSSDFFKYLKNPGKGASK
ncbi:membrane protease subunit HflC [Chitinivorax tropicus]|uniref:Protein HflC n=1 Tax=Chitinivorax tropicus TaxID=714531 RepID=A0A840MXB0_9PROT|nr:protease modulator HflC [Chitinivorax tropicus]MBB5019791.1 membrane protease subunit HflC [Chitinivorax tropicus]